MVRGNLCKIIKLIFYFYLIWDEIKPKDCKWSLKFLKSCKNIFSSENQWIFRCSMREVLSNCKKRTQFTYISLIIKKIIDIIYIF